MENDDLYSRMRRLLLSEDQQGGWLISDSRPLTKTDGPSFYKLTQSFCPYIKFHSKITK